MPEAIEIGVAAIEAHPEVGFVFGRYLYQLAGADGSYTTEQTFEHQPAVANYATILADRHRIQIAKDLFLTRNKTNKDSSLSARTGSRDKGSAKGSFSRAWKASQQYTGGPEKAT